MAISIKVLHPEIDPVFYYTDDCGNHHCACCFQYYMVGCFLALVEEEVVPETDGDHFGYDH